MKISWFMIQPTCFLIILDRDTKHMDDQAAYLQANVYSMYQASISCPPEVLFEYSILALGRANVKEPNQLI